MNKMINILRFLFSLKWIIIIINRIKLTNTCLGKGIKFYGLIIVRNQGSISIGSNCTFNSGKNRNIIGGDTQLAIIVKKNAVLSLGDNVGISNSTIYSSKSVVIENNVMIGGGCKIYDSDFHSINFEDRISAYLERRGDINAISKPIKICNGAWIGGHSIILKGVEIGSHSIIGAGSVVTKNVPEKEVWAGNPARFVKKIE